jgi:hypothetical protein
MFFSRGVTSFRNAGTSQIGLKADEHVRPRNCVDKHWKRRVQALPQPNQLAQVYGPSELPTFVAALEAIC